jgi:hypothetical protein
MAPRTVAVAKVRSMMPKLFEPLLRHRLVDDAGTPRAIIAAETGR